MNWLPYSLPKEISVNKWRPCNEIKYIQHNNLASKLCFKYSHKSHVSWNKMTHCVVIVHSWAGCTLHPGTVWRNLSETPFGQNPRCSCPNEKHKSLKEKHGKQFPRWCVISQCYCQHGEMLWRWTKANMKHCNKHQWYLLLPFWSFPS